MPRGPSKEADAIRETLSTELAVSNPHGVRRPARVELPYPLICARRRRRNAAVGIRDAQIVRGDPPSGFLRSSPTRRRDGQIGCGDSRDGVGLLTHTAEGTICRFEDSDLKWGTLFWEAVLSFSNLEAGPF